MRSVRVRYIVGHFNLFQLVHERPQPKIGKTAAVYCSLILKIAVRNNETGPLILKKAQVKLRDGRLGHLIDL
jgi:hypothetical protein